MLFNLPPLSSLHAFEAAARHGSFAAAALELNVTQSAISHRIKHLESHLGYPLFERLPRSLKLNEMGNAYLPSVRQAFNEIASSTAGIFGSSGKQTVTIRVPITHAVLWLAPRIESFLLKHTDIDVRIGSALWSDNLPTEEVDLELRFGPGNWENFESVLLQQESAVAVCSQLHLDTYGKPGSLQQLSERPRVNTLGYDNLWQRLFRGAGISTESNHNSIWVDSTLAAIEMAASGVRCALVPKGLLDNIAVSSRLKLAYDTEVTMHDALYLLTPQKKKQISTPAQLLKQWLQEQV